MGKIKQLRNLDGWTKRHGTLPPGVKSLRTIEGHRNRVLSVAFHPQGKILASGGERDDDTVKLWEVRSGKLFRTTRRVPDCGP